MKRKNCENTWESGPKRTRDWRRSEAKRKLRSGELEEREICLGFPVSFLFWRNHIKIKIIIRIIKSEICVIGPQTSELLIFGSQLLKSWHIGPRTYIFLAFVDCASPSVNFSISPSGYMVLIWIFFKIILKTFVVFWLWIFLGDFYFELMTMDDAN